MIKLSVQTGGIEEVHGIDGAYRLIHECGFDSCSDSLYSGWFLRSCSGGAKA